MNLQEKEKALADRLKKNWEGPMSDEEISFLRDVQGMIDFVIRNGLSFPVVLGALLHDLGEIRNNDFNLRKAKSTGFHPKVSGYAKYTDELIGQTEEDD